MLQMDHSHFTFSCNKDAWFNLSNHITVTDQILKHISAGFIIFYWKPKGMVYVFHYFDSFAVKLIELITKN